MFLNSLEKDILNDLRFCSLVSLVKVSLFIRDYLN